MESLIAIHSAKKEFGYYYDLCRLKNENEFRCQVQKIIEVMGFSHFSFMSLNNTQSNVNKLDSFPLDMQRKYIDNNYVLDDPVIEHAKNTEYAFYSSQVQDELAQLTIYCRATRQCQLIYKLHKSYGYYNFLHVTIANDCLLTVAKRGVSPINFKQKFDGFSSTLQLLGEAIYRVGIENYPQFFPTVEDVDLNEKPLNVLHALANSDLTIGQLADKLNISRITANHHLKTVRNRLGVNTNYAAIKKAMQEKLIRYQ